MNTAYLNKWKNLNKVLEEYTFVISNTIDDWNHCYYSNKFDGRLEYDIESDEISIYDVDNIEIRYLSESTLNELELRHTLEFILL